ncbi:rRNA maturation RNase YbeY [Buchnera aphidicola (Muscaphis stroyani)]|uniref:Endoribonuclease YbeY n=1 Tax=Buchnera aphidicola (Muscaphis stroyani) TaxID=1241869 RepID=A0A4D6YFD6_9GAMM|nr:rRNA maturation RNase YbeY [Buchnera aphidicola]QCI24488.1 rRNA maturation RNase YbeY [Buchnera aphidicola (Muscaphis stroyani)]
MKNVILNLQILCEKKNIPTKINFNQWIQKVLHKKKINEITVRIVNELEIQYLNYTYRKKDKTTNVLSFPMNIFLKKNHIILGDLVFCKSVIEQQAIKYKQELESYWALMTIHGTLHLLGYDHKTKKTSIKMEKIENKIMLSLNYSKPYL